MKTKDFDLETEEPAQTIEMIWVKDGRIYLKTTEGKEYSQPLEAFPALKDATEEQRSRYIINKWRDAIHWPDIDEDIHISNFFEPETPNYDNEVNRLLSNFPWLNIAEFAKRIGMHKTKLDRFRYGIWTPSQESMAKIKMGLISIKADISAAVV